MPSGSRPSPGNLSQAVAAILDEVRRTRGMTTTELGVSVGVSPSQMSKYLRAKRPMTVDDLDAICAALKISVTNVMREADRARR